MKAGRFALVLASAMLSLMLVSGAVMAKDQKEQLYPNTTREEPKLDLTKQADAKKLNEGLGAANDGDDAKAEALLQPMADGSASKSKYVQAMALQGLANIKYQQDNIKDAIRLMKSSLDIGIMPNDTYFQLMYGLVQFYVADEQYENAITLLDTWRKEGKRETAQSYALEGNIDYRLQKFPEAITALKKAKSMTDKPEPTWDQILAASYAETGQSDDAVQLAKQSLAENPKDITTLRNTVSLLVQAQNYPEAIRLMETARSGGNLTEGSDLITLAKMYVITAQESDSPKPGANKAIALLEDGVKSGTIEPGYDVYKLEGDAAYIADDYKQALAAYAKAEPFSKDGELQVRRAQILANEGRNDEAIKVAQAGINKGVKDMGKAYMTLGAANANANNRKAAIAAMKKAAEYPETKSQANAWLHKAGVR